MIPFTHVAVAIITWVVASLVAGVAWAIVMTPPRRPR